MTFPARSGRTVPCAAVARPALFVGALALALLAGDVPLARAQSPFALRNIGQNIWEGDARIVGRGGWGMTIADTLALGFKNVAGLADNPLLGVHFTGFGERNHATVNGGERRTYRTFAPDFRVSVPIEPRRVALTAGFKIRRATHYTTREDRTWDADEGTISGFEEYAREGSLLDVPLGASVRLGATVSLGATLNLVRGTVVQNRRTVFLVLDRGGETEPIVAPYLSADEEQEDQYNGTSFTLSALFKRMGPLSVGISHTPAHDVTLERKISLSGVARRSLATFRLRMPAETVIGAALRLGERWRCGADVERREFSAFRGQPEWEPDMADEWTISAGFERILARERRGGFANRPVRFGVQHRQWAYRVEGSLVDEWVYSAGTGFSLEGGRGQLDLALSYGTIGELAKNGVESDYWRVTVSITGLEKWW